MLNAEKYKDEIMNNCKCKFGFNNRIVKCEECPSCLFSNANNDDLLSCTTRKVKWLLSEYKEPVKLTRLEYEILKLLEKGGYKFIVRSPSDNLIAYNSAPRKAFTGWVSEYDFNELVFENKYKMLWSFNELFKFVKWEDEKPTSIKEVLENCAVENIEEEQ